MQSSDAIRSFALYIDLRQYDKMCAEMVPDKIKKDFAVEIYEDYL